MLGTRGLGLDTYDFVSCPCELMLELCRFVSFPTCPGRCKLCLVDASMVPRVLHGMPIYSLCLDKFFAVKELYCENLRHLFLSQALGCEKFIILG